MKRFFLISSMLFAAVVMQAQDLTSMVVEEGAPVPTNL